MNECVISKSFCCKENWKEDKLLGCSALKVQQHFKVHNEFGSAGGKQRDLRGTISSSDVSFSLRTDEISMASSTIRGLLIDKDLSSQLGNVRIGGGRTVGADIIHTFEANTDQHLMMLPESTSTTQVQRRLLS